MRKTLVDLWNDVDSKSFFLELNDFKICKEEIQHGITLLKKNLMSIAEWNNRKVFFDIKDRKVFIFTFLAMLELNAKLVLVPGETKVEDYFYNNCLFLSDNKKLDKGIFIENSLFVKPGRDFNPDKIEGPENNNVLMYLYTSGSTGKAKLIPKTAGNLLTELEELKEILKITKDSIFYFTPPLYHIYGLLFGFLLPFYCSCGIILDYNFTPDSIADFVKMKEITDFISIPSYYKLFSEINNLDKFYGCTRLISSSAPLPVSVSKKFYENNMTITEIYGSTETGGIAYRSSAISLKWNLYSYVNIFNKSFSYLNGAEEEKIIELRIDSPAISVNYDKLTGYNTGDIVEFDNENKFMLLGRNTRFVKISGKRVDLHYVNSKFIEYMKNENNVFVKEDHVYTGIFNEKIFIICEVEFPKSTKIIKDDLKKHLPGYAIPRVLINNKIPRNNMGKINKNKIEIMVKNILQG